jgi:hypothetical protein
MKKSGAPTNRSVATDAERRRRALKQALDGHNLTPTEASRAAGLVTPNSIYNFLSGRSNSLSQATMERLARAIPDASLEELAGFRGTAIEPRTIMVKTPAKAGVFKDTFERPAEPGRDPAARQPKDDRGWRLCGVG